MSTTGGTQACFLGVDVRTSACQVIVVDQAGARAAPPPFSALEAVRSMTSQRGSG